MKRIKKTINRRVFLEAAFVAAAAAIIAVVLTHHVPRIIGILETGNVNDIETYLQSEGSDGRVLLVLLQVIETVSIILPAMPVYICAGILFGRFRGIMVCYLINLILNILMFLAGRRMADWTQKHFDLRKNPTVSHLVDSAKHLDRVVLAMCLIPVVPNGTIPFLSSQTNISAGQFFRAVAIGSIPSIAINVCFGDLLLSDGWKIVLPIILVLAVLGILFWVFRKRVMAGLRPRLKKFVEG